MYLYGQGAYDNYDRKGHSIDPAGLIRYGKMFILPSFLVKFAITLEVQEGFWRIHKFCGFIYIDPYWNTFWSPAFCPSATVSGFPSISLLGDRFILASLAGMAARTKIWMLKGLTNLYPTWALPKITNWREFYGICMVTLVDSFLNFNLLDCIALWWVSLGLVSIWTKGTCWCRSSLHALFSHHVPQKSKLSCPTPSHQRKFRISKHRTTHNHGKS